MKLTHSVDLDGIRIAAKARVNSWFHNISSQLHSPVPLLHSVKQELAQKIVSGESAWIDGLKAEAEAFGVTQRELAEKILARVAEVKQGLLALEADRQSKMREIEAATSEQAVQAVVLKTIGGASQ